MEFTLSITGTNAADLQQVLAAFSGTGLPINGTTATPRKAKQLTDDAAGPALPAVDTKSEAAGSLSTTTANGAINIEQVRAAVKTKADVGKREEVKSLLLEFGADSVTKLEPAKYADFIQKLNAL